MKKIICFVCITLVLVAGGCALSLPEVNVTSGYEYSYQTTVSDAGVSETQMQDIQNETTVQEFVTTDSTSVPESTVHTSEEQTTIYESPTTPVQQETTAAPEIPSEMDLSISMPDKNGTMVTDKSKDNKFIRIINSQRKIDPSLLVAVYAVPESGQNYVFEFEDAAVRSADSLRRVYLIDSTGNITGVASSVSSEKEHLSAVENWFCMNVLIKEVIFPAIEKDIKA